MNRVVTETQYDSLGRLVRIAEGIQDQGALTCPAGSERVGDGFGCGTGAGACFSSTPFPGGAEGTPIGWGGYYIGCPFDQARKPLRVVETDWLAGFHLPTERRIYNGTNTLVAKSTWTYNSRGQVLTASQVDPTTSAARTTTFTYCEASDVAASNSTCPTLGLLKSVNGPLSGSNDTTTYTYRPSDDLAGCATIGSGNCHRKGDLWRVADGFGHETVIGRYDLAGRVTQAHDANGVVTRLAYDARGRMTTRTVFGSISGVSTDDAISTVEYDDLGQVVKMTDPEGAFVAFTYDAAHRLERVEDGLGNSIDYSIDDAGNIYQEDTRDSGNALRRTMNRLFDDFGRLETLADADANATDFTYDAAGNLDTATDALGRITDNDFDALGRLRKTIANSAGTGGERAVSEFEYDALDRLTAVEDPNGLTTSYDYDGLGNLVELVSPDTGTTSYGYDVAGNRTGELDARGVASAFAYDRLNRLTGIDRPTAGQDSSFAYDSAPSVCDIGETFAVGRLGSMTDPSGSTAFCYDRRGNLVRKVQAVTGATVDLTVRYGHSLADRVTSITYPSGATVTYTRDATGRITGVSGQPTVGATAVTLISDVDYLPFGPANVITFGNGRTLTKSYDQNYGINAVTDSASGGLSIDLGLDDVGNVTAVDERLANEGTAARTIAYDGLDRLESLDNGVTPQQAFTYDATGNRLAKTTPGGTATYGYAANSHKLTSDGVQSRTVDAAGHGTAIGSRSFVYDDSGRMVEMRDSGTLMRSYRHNARGERVAKIHPTTSASDVFYVYNEAGHLLGEYRGDGTAIREIVWLDDLPVAVFASHAGTTYQYILSDHLNTPRAVVLPTTNAIVWRWDLTGSAFGEHAVDANPDGDANSYTLNLRYPGQLYDAESGLHYNYFRDYEPATGRYLQSDPIGLFGGMSTYSYVDGDPLSGLDPLGLRNWHKTVVSVLNAANSFRLFTSGAGKIGTGVLGLATGGGSAPGAGAVAWGLWNVASAKAAWDRATQQWSEAACETTDDYTIAQVIKTYAGVLPFGTAVDDPYEPYFVEVAEQKVRNAANEPLELAQEIGTMGF